MIAMYNRCSPHFDEGILPVCRKNHNTFCMIKASLIVAISLLILLPATSLAVAPKYETAYACEGKTLTIECEQGDLINLIRANYGRFSIAICNDHGNVEWSVNCMSPKSLRVLHSKCTHKQNCSVLASTNMFGDPCPGTHKYLEAHYQCISAAQTSTTTNRPSPPWLLTSTPSTLIGIGDNGVTITVPVIGGGGGGTVSGNVLGRLPTTLPKGGSNTNYHHDSTSIHYHNKPPPPPLLSPSSTNSGSGGSEIHLAGGRPPIVISNENANTTATNTGIVKVGSKVHRPITGLPRPSPNGQPDTNNFHTLNADGNNSVSISSGSVNNASLAVPTQISPTLIKNNTAVKHDLNNNNNNNFKKTLGTSVDNAIIYNNNNNNQNGVSSDATQSSVLENSNNNQNHHHHNNNNNNNQYNTNNIIRNNYNGIDGVGDNNFYCGPTTARNLFWNVTRVGEVNVQPCPGGATGIAKWRCGNANFRQNDILNNGESNNRNNNNNNSNESQNGASDCDKGIYMNNCDINKNRNDQPTWHPMTPDLTQCRSLWLNSLEIGVNQRDSSLISIANDLSQVTSSKTLYGGDMLVTTKIIQTMSEKMSYDVETFPDQRQREAIIFELLHGVVKTGSNLLDESQHLSWLDLSFEDQMRVATSLLTGLEDNAFLLADTIIRERNVMQKVKNILLSVRVLETKNIVANEIFPDGKLEQWSVSDDRIELPRGALIENSEGGLVRIVFVAFDRLESILKPSYDVKFSRNYVQGDGINDPKPIQILNSKVISASLGKGRHIQLSQPIKLILRHLKTENVSSPTCVYWNYIDHAWSADGCFLESTNRTHSICMCNHLTNFAILMDVIDERSGSMIDNMRILIYISIAICIIFIVIAILTLKLFNGVFIKSTRTSIYKNIYICLFMIEILFLFGIEQSETSLLCGFTTIFLHCFVLSAIAWLCFEGFQSYVTLTTDDMLLEVENSSKVIGYYLLSYGLSLTIVAISLAIDPATYTQSDFCVLMEANALFYTTFFAPIVLFLLGAIGYTILACFIMYKKNKSTIKNKEHTRLTNVRFDIRCSIIFLMSLLADWIFAYLYFRKAKYEEESADSYGYLFITFNSLLGIYIFIFHCVQNEKIRREYRKYVRQNSWLPKCLRCSKTSSISSSSSHGHHHHYGGTNSATTNKKSPIGMSSVTDPAEENIIVAGASGSITPIANVASKFVTGEGGILTGTLQHAKTNSMMGSMQGISPGHIILERATGGTLRTPSGGHTSPTSSVGSTHLIFNSKQTDPQNWTYHQQPEYYATNRPGSDSKNFNTYDDKFLYYDSKSKRIKSGYPMSTTPRSINSSAVVGAASGNIMIDPQYQQHEYFYWTEKNNQKKMNGDLKAQKSDTMHTFYPSYKKTTMTKHHYPGESQTTSSDAGLPLEDEADRKYYHHHRYPSKQLSSDDGDSSTHHLMQGNQQAATGGVGVGSGVGVGLLDPGDGSLSSHPSDCFPTDLQSYHQNYRHKHSSEFVDGGSYYNQGDVSADEPVYEEILNSRLSEMCEDDDDNGRRPIRKNKIDIDEDGNEEDDENDDVENMIMEEKKYNRIRRMMANKDESFKRQRFHRQDKNLPIGFAMPGGGYNYQQHGSAGGVGKSPTHDRDDGGASSISSSSNSRVGLPIGPMHHHQRAFHQPKPSLQPQPHQAQQQMQQQQYPIGRNISAMLDENNTVVCYLEPLPK